MIIKTPSRIHMGLIDLNGSNGRYDGGIGLTIEKPNFILKCDNSEKGITIDFDKSIRNDKIKEQCVSKIIAGSEKIISHFQIESGFHFDVKEAYFSHSGLGSGTQISLATAKLICEYNDIPITGLELGKILKRGGTSGIGIYSFEKGGLVIDGGHDKSQKSDFLPSSASDAKPPVLIGRYEFPKDWEIIIAIPESNNIKGEKEVNIFQKYCPIPKTEVEKLSYLIFMNLIPYLLEKNIKPFGETINKIQNIGFKKIEVNLQQDKIKNLMEKMREFGAYGVGMSSFGPAIYGIVDKNNSNVLKSVKKFLGDEGVVFKTNAQNHGFEIKK
ncbi:MAG: beta-ribofuranosylaminobenzene 5'-phosphate synthase [Methanobrevibacter sp.]|nr:beta-ribofuranosylaminobenzene 5'-phosphate synthase [Methanobrevibacter sp.]